MPPTTRAQAPSLTVTVNDLLGCEQGHVFNFGLTWLRVPGLRRGFEGLLAKHGNMGAGLQYLGVFVHLVDSANQQRAGSYGDEVELAVEEYWNWYMCDKELAGMQRLDPAWQYEWVGLERIPEDDARAVRAAVVRLATR